MGDGLLRRLLNGPRGRQTDGAARPPEELHVGVRRQHGGDYESPDFVAEFNLGSSNTVQHVGVVLYGTTTASEPMFAVLEQRYGWVTTHP